MKVSVELDQSDVKQILADLETLRRAVRGPAVARAINRTGENLIAEAVRSVRGELKTLRAKTVRDRFFLKRATGSNPVGQVDVFYQPIPLIEYGARQTKTGVSVSVKKGRKRIGGSFIATMRSGHRGVFSRRGKSRLPIDEHFGPSVREVFENHRDAVNAHATERLLVNLRHEISFRRSQEPSAIFERLAAAAA